MLAKKVLGICSALAHISTCASSGLAADTVEPWDTGYGDVDHYWGYDGIGLERSERSVYGDTMLGWGVGHRISAYLGTKLSGNGYLTSVSADPFLGVYGTPVDTDHLDLDLFMRFGQGDGALVITPAFELNIDAAPDLADFGLYLRGAVPVTGRSDPANPDDPGETTYRLEPLVGAYKKIGSNQFLVEFDMVIRPDAAEEERETEVGGVALGWNHRLSETLELINQVSMDIPQDDEDMSFGVFTGFIATLGNPAE